MHALSTFGIFLSLMILESVAAASIRIEEREAAKLKRQFETTCAFYRWSHCPGKKEVDNVRPYKLLSDFLTMSRFQAFQNYFMEACWTLSCLSIAEIPKQISSHKMKLNWLIPKYRMKTILGILTDI